MKITNEGYNIISAFFSFCSWTSAQSLFVKSNFFKELEFYKKDSIPDGIFKSLEKFINDPKVKSVSFLPVKNMKEK